MVKTWKEGGWCWWSSGRETVMERRLLEYVDEGGECEFGHRFEGGYIRATRRSVSSRQAVGAVRLLCFPTRLHREGERRRNPRCTVTTDRSTHPDITHLATAGRMTGEQAEAQQGGRLEGEGRRPERERALASATRSSLGGSKTTKAFQQTTLHIEIQAEVELQPTATRDSTTNPDKRYPIIDTSFFVARRSP